MVIVMVMVVVVIVVVIVVVLVFVIVFVLAMMTLRLRNSELTRRRQKHPWLAAVRLQVQTLKLQPRQHPS